MTTSHNKKSLNFARLTHRLLTDQRGMNLKALLEEFDITDRTWRTYRSELHELEFFQDDRGESLIEEIGEGAERRVRLKVGIGPHGASTPSFRSRLVAMHMVRSMFNHLRHTSLGEEIEDILDRVQDAFRDITAVKHAMRHADRKLHVIDGASKKYDQKEEILEQLIRATLQERQVEMRYMAGWTREESARVIEPLSLVNYRGSLYVLARHPPEEGEVAQSDLERDVFTYAVDRFIDVTLLDATFSYPSPEAFDPESFFDGDFGIFQKNKHKNTRPIEVRLEFADVAWLKQFLQERDWHPTQRFTPLPDGKLEMRFSVRSMQSVWSFIRSFGDDVRVISPEGPIPMTSEQVRAWRAPHEA